MREIYKKYLANLKMEGEASGQDTQVAPENGKSEKVASLEFQKRPSDNLI